MEVCWCQFWMVLHSSSYFWLDTRQLGTYSWVFLKQSLHTGKRLLSYDRCYDKPGCAVKKLHYWETSKMCPGAAGICVYLVSSVSTAGANNCWDSCASVKWSICLENNLRYFHINWWGYIFDLSELIEIKSSFINGKTLVSCCALKSKFKTLFKLHINGPMLLMALSLIQLLWASVQVR